MDALVHLKLKIEILSLCLLQKNEKINKSINFVTDVNLEDGDTVTVSRNSSSVYATISLKKGKSNIYFKIKSLSEPLIGDKHIFYHTKVETAINPNQSLTPQIEMYLKSLSKKQLIVEGLSKFFTKGKCQGIIKIKQ